MSTQVYVPPGWPDQVRPPGAPSWERTAAVFLIDLCPPDYRAYAVLRNHPVVLARFANHSVQAQLAATRANLAGLRAELQPHVHDRVLDAAADALQREEAKLLRVARAVDLVERSLRGEIFVAKL